MKNFLLGLFISVATFANAQKNLALQGTITFPGQSLAGCWHYTDSTGYNYALIGVSDALAIADIQDPFNPVVLQSIPCVQSIWREVKVLGKYAYAVTEGSGSPGQRGLLIVDLSTLPGTCAYKFWDGNGAIAGQLNTGHTVTVDTGYVYINGSNLANGGVIIADLSDPWNPTYVGQYNTNYCHDTYVYNDTMWTSEIYLGQFGVVDVTNKSNPNLLVTQATPGAFNHNSWLSDNKQFLYTTDETNNAPLGSFDVSNIFNISLLDVYVCDTLSTAEVHNVRVINDYLICPSYGSQITIVDAARPANLIEVGNYITGSYLCWDADPYLPSGGIIATDMNGVFYIFEPNYVRACYLEGNVTDSVSTLPINGATVQILLTNKIVNSVINGDYKTGVADSGYYTVQCTKAGYYTKTFTNVPLQNGIVNILNIPLVPIGFGIEENSESGVSVYPNPISEQATISFGTKTHAKILTNIYDIAGRLVRTENFNSKNSPAILKKGNLEKGAYTLEVVADGKVIAKEKLIVE